MAEEDLERTEPASQRKLERAREDGFVPQSRDLTLFLLLATVLFVLSYVGHAVLSSLHDAMRNALTFSHDILSSPQQMLIRLSQIAVEMVGPVLPISFAAMLVALLAPNILSGFNFAPKALMPRLDRVSPMAGFGRIFSTKGLVELVKSLLKIILVSVIGVWMVLSNEEAVVRLAGQDMNIALHDAGLLMLRCLWVMVGGLGFIALIDAPWQLWSYYDNLKMSKQELKQENKESEGSPETKKRIRKQQQEIARQRMMSKIETADVVVTNPTHYAVALKYQEGTAAPKVVAKGTDLVAERIRELAMVHSIPIMEAPALARALWAHVDLDREIPVSLFNAVAEVLAYVYQLKSWRLGDGDEPRHPGEIEIPAELDPLNSQQTDSREDGELR